MKCELTKAEENTKMTNGQVLAQAKIAEAQRAQSAVINSLSKMKESNEI